MACSALTVICSAQHMHDVSMVFRPTLRSHVHVKPTLAHPNSITNEHMEVAADNADGHADEGSCLDNLDEDIPAHVDEGLPINKHNFKDGLRRGPRNVAHATGDTGG